MQKVDRGLTVAVVDNFLSCAARVIKLDTARRV